MLVAEELEQQAMMELPIFIQQALAECDKYLSRKPCM